MESIWLQENLMKNQFFYSIVDKLRKNENWLGFKSVPDFVGCKLVTMSCHNTNKNAISHFPPNGENGGYGIVEVSTVSPNLNFSLIFPQLEP